MGIRVFKPRTPAMRKTSVSDFKEITKGKPEKSLVRPLKKKAARNNRGRSLFVIKGVVTSVTIALVSDKGVYEVSSGRTGFVVTKIDDNNKTIEELKEMGCLRRYNIISKGTKE